MMVPVLPEVQLKKITFESGVTKVPSHLCEGLIQLKTIEWGNVASLGYHRLTAAKV